MEKVYYGTYENGQIVHKEVTDQATKKRFFEIRSELWALNNEDFADLIKIIGEYAWDLSRSTAMKVRHALKRYGIHATPTEAAMWYYLDEE